jgi:hypothetical protein
MDHGLLRDGAPLSEHGDPRSSMVEMPEHRHVRTMEGMPGAKQPLLHVSLDRVSGPAQERADGGLAVSEGALVAALGDAGLRRHG